MAKLTMNAEMESYNARSEHDLVRCSICASACGDVKRKKSLRLASHRKGEDDNYLYCPSRQIVEEEGVAHFQKHWVRGEPVIVCNVLEGGSGLSWEPMVMWRAVRETTKNKFERDTRTVAAIDCLDWQEVKVDQIKVSLNQFYSEIHPFVVYGLGYMSSELLVIQRLAIDIHVNWWSLGCAG
jgi:lysine-specific demethylase 3